VEVLPFTAPMYSDTDTSGTIIAIRCTWSDCIFSSTTSHPWHAIPILGNPDHMVLAVPHAM
jgi:hypothetical protein